MVFINLDECLLKISFSKILLNILWNGAFFLLKTIQKKSSKKMFTWSNMMFFLYLGNSKDWGCWCYLSLCLIIKMLSALWLQFPMSIARDLPLAFTCKKPRIVLYNHLNFFFFFYFILFYLLLFFFSGRSRDYKFFFKNKSGVPYFLKIEFWNFLKFIFSKKM